MYICVMKCEGKKTYPTQGKCPVCGMKLVPYEEKKEGGENSHDHK